MCTAKCRENKSRASSRETRASKKKSRSLHIEARRQPSGTVSFVTGSSPRNQTVGLVPVLMNHEETQRRGGRGKEWAATRRRRPRGRQTESAFMWKAKEREKKVRVRERTARFRLFSFALRRPSAHDARCASARSFGSIVGRDARQDATNASYESSSTASSKTSSASARLPSSGSDAPSAGDADAEVALARRWLDAQDATRERAAASPRRRCDARTAETLRA